MKPRVDASFALLRRGQVYHSRDEVAAGWSAAPGDCPRLSLAPALLVTDDARWLRRRLADLPPLDIATRRRLIHEALMSFDCGTVTPPGWTAQTADDFHVLLQSRHGLPHRLTQKWSAMLRAMAVGLIPAKPATITAISLPANTFLCLETCLADLLSAEAVWLRPSRREPFAAARLIGALVEAGWPAERLGFYPSNHEGLRGLVRVVDRATVYGGSDLAVEFGAEVKVDLRGPGRGCAIVPAGSEVNDAVTWLCRRIADDSGRFCSSVGTIFCADPDELGPPLAAALDRIAMCDPLDQVWPQALLPPADVAAHHDWIAARLRPNDHVLTQQPQNQPTGAAHPLLIRLGDAFDHPLVGLELPFPAAVIARPPANWRAQLREQAQFVYVYGETDCFGEGGHPSSACQPFPNVVESLS